MKTEGTCTFSSPLIDAAAPIPSLIHLEVLYPDHTGFFLVPWLEQSCATGRRVPWSSSSFGKHATRIAATASGLTPSCIAAGVAGVRMPSTRPLSQHRHSFITRWRFPWGSASSWKESSSIAHLISMSCTMTYSRHRLSGGSR